MNFELSWKKSGEDKYWTLNFLLIEKFDFALQAGFLNIWTYFFDIIGISSSMQCNMGKRPQSKPAQSDSIISISCAVLITFSLDCLTSPATYITSSSLLPHHHFVGRLNNFHSPSSFPLITWRFEPQWSISIKWIWIYLNFNTTLPSAEVEWGNINPHWGLMFSGSKVPSIFVAFIYLVYRVLWRREEGEGAG